MRKKMETLSGLIAVIVVLVVAAAVVAQVYPVKWEEEPEAVALEAGAPQLALTIDSFYVRNRSFDCPSGTGVDCDVPGELFTTKCDAGDSALGGTAYVYFTSATTYGTVPSRSWGGAQPRGWQAMLKKVQEGRTLFVKVVCAEVM